MIAAKINSGFYLEVNFCPSDFSAIQKCGFVKSRNHDEKEIFGIEHLQNSNLQTQRSEVG